MKIGYARVSTEEQVMDRQLDSLKINGVERIFMEKITGKKLDRPELNKLLEFARKGDIVLVSDLTRLSRSAKDLIEVSEQLTTRGIELISIKENIDTMTATGKAMFGMLAVMAQFERDIIAERTAEGLRAARARGRYGGRPRKSEIKCEQAARLYKDKNYTIKEIHEMTGVSKATLYRYLKLLIEREGK